ncbi:unnamed protein product [Phaeothamnion confervicola]
MGEEEVDYDLQCGSLGIHDEAALEEFLEKYLSTFTLIIPTEVYEEGMVLLAGLMGWPLTDVMYETRNTNTGKTYVTYRDGTLAEIEKGPAFDELHPVAQERLSAAVSMDDRLYAAAWDFYAAIKANYGVEKLQREVEEFQKLQANFGNIIFGHRKGCMDIDNDWETCNPGAHWGAREYLDCYFG